MNSGEILALKESIKKSVAGHQKEIKQIWKELVFQSINFEYHLTDEEVEGVKGLIAEVINNKLK